MMRKPGWMVGVAGVIATMAALLFSLQAAALGLGAIQVKSGLGQQFSAVIPLRVDSPSDLDGLTVSLADPAAFRQAGVISTSAVSMLHFKVQKLDGGGAEVLVSSSQPIRDPFVNFLVSVNWNGGTLLRQYTVLLNPPDYHGAGTSTAVASGAPTASAAPIPHSGVAQAVPVEPSVPRTAGREARADAGRAAAVPVARPPVHAAPRQSGSAGAAQKAYAGGHYGPVAPGQTLWSIGEQVRPDPSITMDQVLLSIYDANPRAFSHGRFDGLIKGSRLRIPTAEQMREVSVAAAAERVTRLRAAVGESVLPRAGSTLHRATPTERHPAREVMATESKSAVVEPKPGVAQTAPPEAGHSAPAENLGALVGAEGTGAHDGVAATAEGESAATGGAAAPATSGGQPAAATSTAASVGVGSASTASAAASPAAAHSAAAPAAASAAANNGNGSEVAAASQAQKPARPVRKNPAHAIPKAPAASSLPIDWRLVAAIVILLLLLGALVVRNRKRKRGDGAADPETPSDGPQKHGRRMRRGKGDAAEAPATRNEATTLAVEATSGEAVATPIAVDAASAAVAAHVDDVAAEANMPVPEAAPSVAQVLPGNEDDSKDALADAEFHLAYGLYDAAIPLLKQAIAQHPDRPDLKLRLADACFSAGNAGEFEGAAGALRGSVDDAAWRKLAAKGRRLCPDSSLFQGVPPPTDTDVPTMDTPEWAIPTEAPEAGEQPPRSLAPDPESPASAPVREVLDAAAVKEADPLAFQEQPLTPGQSAVASGAAVDAATPAARDENVIEFDAGEAGAPPVEQHAAAAAVANPDGPKRMIDGPTGDDRVSDIFDVTGFDAPAGADAVPQGGEDAGKLDLGPLPFNLGDEETAGVRSASGAGTRPATDAPTAAGPRAASADVAVDGHDDASAYASKLELARVYATMGDGEGAREVLQEVLDHGTAADKAAAEQVLQSVAGQS
ncbi:MAG TPA: FimV/HubP family polar landmark protein [Nevskiaceae bacterium]